MKFNTGRFVFLFLFFFACFEIGYWLGYDTGKKDGVEKQQKQEELNKLKHLDDKYKYDGQGKCAGC